MNTKSPISPVSKTQPFENFAPADEVQTYRSKKEFFDVLIAREFETGTVGASEKRTTWHKVGRAWKTKSGSSLSIELFLLPNQRLVIPMEREALSDHAGS
jgi:hypothetical protein